MPASDTLAQPGLRRVDATLHTVGGWLTASSFG